MFKLCTKVQALRASVVGASPLPDVLGVRRYIVRIILKSFLHNRVKVLTRLSFFLFGRVKVIARLLHPCFRLAKVDPSLTLVLADLLKVIPSLVKVSLRLQNVVARLMNVVDKPPKVTVSLLVLGSVKIIQSCSFDSALI